MQIKQNYDLIYYKSKQIDKYEKYGKMNYEDFLRKMVFKLFNLSKEENKVFY